MFGFPRVDRQKNFQFKRNFLKSAIFQVRFERNPRVMNKKKAIIESLEGIYPNHNIIKGVGIGLKFEPKKTPIVEQLHEDRGAILFKSKDLKRILNISDEAITFTTLGKGYTNFDDFLTEINKFKAVYDISGIKEFNRVAIRKINIIEFSPREGFKNLSVDFLPVIFNNAIVDSYLIFPGRSNIEQGITTLNYISGDNRLNLIYGLLPFNNQTKRHSVMLDIDVFSTASSFKTGKLSTKLTEINSEIFNIFNWAISEQAKEFLNNNNDE